MRFRIQHHTCYTYSQPVTLQSHQLQLRPREDGCQRLSHFQVVLDPAPQHQCPLTDLDGNAPIAAVFHPTPTLHLTVEATSEVETCRTNPFDYLATPWAATLPGDYPASLAHALAPYRQPVGGIAGAVADLAEDIAAEVDGNTGLFLTALTQRIYTTCQYEVRPTGHPWPPSVTWTRRRGSCRDFTTLFMAACRQVGLAARFVSGYEAGDEKPGERDLHAWAEVYVPGGGWRGFDPTTGLAVADRHVALAASATPAHTAPVIGTTQEGGRVRAQLTSRVTMTVLG